MTDQQPFAEAAAALHGLDADAFGLALEPYRARLRLHCYRLMGSLQDAEGRTSR
jgi:DNA-directed RNA polymerase specialized sigma24 family protein